MRGDVTDKVSACCKAAVVIGGRPGLCNTRWHECSACGKPCGIEEK